MNEKRNGIEIQEELDNSLTTKEISIPVSDQDKIISEEYGIKDTGQEKEDQENTDKELKRTEIPDTEEQPWAEEQLNKREALRAEEQLNKREPLRTEEQLNKREPLSTEEQLGTEVRPGIANNALEKGPDNEVTKVSSKKEKKVRRKGRKLNIVLSIIGVLLILIGVAYIAVSMYFRSHFLPNTDINGIDCSYQDAGTAAGYLEEQSQLYELDLVDQDGNTAGTIHASDIDLKIDISGDIDDILAQQNIYDWIFALNSRSSHTIIYDVIFDEDKLVNLLEQFEDLQKENMEQPQNAYIGEYSETLKGYEIIPETRGSVLDLEKVGQALLMAVKTGEAKLDLEAAGCYVRAEITSEDVNLNQKLDTMNTWVGACITYDWNGTEVVLDGSIIHEWIVEEDGRLVLSEDAAADFVAHNAKEYDTYGKKRRFTTTSGQELTLPSGAYGWKTDRKQEVQELLILVEEGSVSEREPVYTTKGFHKGSDDIGSSYVEIDLTNQHLYLYEDGKIVLESDFVSGDMTKKGRMTPPGVFGLTYKTKNAVLRGEDYETPVNYWMPFNGNIGMHDATWRRKFGGEVYITNGSHGCINLPLNNAKEIYSYISTGFPVICYYY